MLATKRPKNPKVASNQHGPAAAKTGSLAASRFRSPVRRQNRCYRFFFFAFLTLVVFALVFFAVAFFAVFFLTVLDFLAFFAGCAAPIKNSSTDSVIDFLATSVPLALPLPQRESAATCKTIMVGSRAKPLFTDWSPHS
jgi:hypothetical protein